MFNTREEDAPVDTVEETRRREVIQSVKGSGTERGPENLLLKNQ